jgi:very-short-patch-repair endonuclease
VSQHIVPPTNRVLAKSMRRAMTEAEFRLWWCLRKPGIEGLRFLRQCPIGPYIVDLPCPQKRLIVEIDGAQHGYHGQQTADAARTKWLERSGYRVIRFWNNEIMSNVQGVCDAIIAAAQEINGD